MHNKFTRQVSFLSGQRSNGFTLIELMIVIATIAILVSLALPVYSNYAIRAKISEGLSIANSAKTAVSATCIENPVHEIVDNAGAGYAFGAGSEAGDYVQNVQASGLCSDPIIVITTRNTGQTPDPIINMNGNLPEGGGQMTWRCSSDNTPNTLLPKSCRS